MTKQYSTEIRDAFDKKYLKVFFLDDNEAIHTKELLENINEVKTVNITESKSKDHPGSTLTIYPKNMISVNMVQQKVENALDAYFSGTIVNIENISSEVHFQAIESKILNALDNAQAIIYVCVAWFTNTKLLDKLLEKKKQGCDVKVITYDDGLNRKYGVDFTGLEHKSLKAERHGTMHRKFCVIDNCDVIDGSYNWTTNAETRNDEDVVIHKNDRNLASSYTQEFNLKWKE